MELTLRKARRLEMSLRNLRIDNAITDIRIYDKDTMLKDMQSGADALTARTEDLLALNSIRFHIRHLINEANMECGISSLLNQRDSLYEEVRILETLPPADEEDDQIRFLEKQRGTDPVPLSIVRESHVLSSKGALSDIRKELEELADDLSDLNNRKSISLEEEDVLLLTHYNYL